MRLLASKLIVALLLALVMLPMAAQAGSLSKKQGQETRRFAYNNSLFVL